ncbi:MAG: TatD family hydrolase [Ferruginibacter sp.]
MIDTHCHLYAEEFRNDLPEVIKKAIELGIERFYLPAIDSSTTNGMLALEKIYPGRCFAMMGLHPCSVNENVRHELYLVEEWLSKRKFAAVGEIGLDFYWDKTFVDQQYTAFRQQVEMALQYDMPIVIHSRNATPETISVINEFSGRKLKGIFHCFGGTIAEAHQITEAGFYLGIGGIVTYKNSGLDLVLPHIDISHIVLETDSPYLAPVPYRGKRNESSYLELIAKKIAECKKITVEEVIEITTANALNVFQKGIY